MSNPTDLPDLDTQLDELLVELVSAWSKSSIESTKKRIRALFARRAQPEGEAPQAEHVNFTPTEQQFADWCERHDVKPHHSREAFDDAVTLYLTAPAATLSPLCGAQHAESGKEEMPFRERFKEAYETLAVAAFASPFWDQSMEGLLVTVDAELTKRAAPGVPGTPEAPKPPAHGHRDDYYLLANGRRLGLEPISRVRNMPNWVLAMELFATGSTSAHQLCRDAGVDPDSATTQRAAALKGGA